MPCYLQIKANWRRHKERQTERGQDRKCESETRAVHERVTEQWEKYPCFCSFLKLFFLNNARSWESVSLRPEASPPLHPRSPSPTLAVSAYSAWFMYYCRRQKKKNVMCSRAESIFWFSTSALIEKLSGLSHSDPVYGCIPLRDGLNWNTTKLYSCQVVWLLCACVVMFCLQGTCSGPRLEQQEVSHIYVPLSGWRASPSSLCYFLRTLVIICYTQCICSVTDAHVIAFKRAKVCHMPDRRACL